MKKDIQINTTFVQQISTPRGCEVDMGQKQRWTEGMLNWSQVNSIECEFKCKQTVHAVSVYSLDGKG